MKPFRFGVQVRNAESGDRWASLARKVEDLGYDTLVLPDHLSDQFAPFPALVAAAAATERIRVGTLVIDNDFLHPALLARDAATVDVLTDGRLELGIGAGWMSSDYETSGIPFDPPGTRIDRLAEAVTILKGLFAGEPVSHSGHNYRIDGLEGRPAPVQRPHPPLLIGGGGRRILGIAGREADIVGINLNLGGDRAGADASAEATDRRIEWVQEAAGDRFDDLELQALVFAVIVTDDRDGAAAGIGQGFDLDAGTVLEVPHFLIGTVEQLADDLQRRRERWGISYYTLQGGMSDFAPVLERLAGK
ncbi:MAG: TIGR03621 family F420-dependent LLM class oxidoreductase [Actinobacteria bacterium]|nr:TIGR03621 family F420-dependent LLM class oxidoreductase [Actinomycetota bacterium]